MAAAVVGPGPADRDGDRGGPQEAVAHQPDGRLGGQAGDAAHVRRRVTLGRGDLQGDLAQVGRHEQVGIVATGQAAAQQRGQHQHEQQQHVRAERAGEEQLELGDGHGVASLVQLEDESPGIGSVRWYRPPPGPAIGRTIQVVRARNPAARSVPMALHCPSGAPSASLAR